MKKCYIYMLFLFLLPFVKTYGQADSLRVSLLTCTPGSDVYAHFGHSAIRIRNLNTDEDFVFNYGMFDYRVESFVFRFVKGETDYTLGAEYANAFFMRYGVKGEGITEQILNLAPYEAEKLYYLIRVNYLPENRQYRYNFLYDNCTTRARNIIEKSVDGQVVYDISNRDLTFRNILREFTKDSPWLEFGIDFVLGEEVDHVVDREQQMFIPSYYMHDMDSAFIMRSDGRRVKLVAEVDTPLVEQKKAEDSLLSMIFTPMTVFVCLFVLTLVVSIRDIKKKSVSWGYDAMLLLLQGLAGIVVAFLFFFSEHPAVGTNWLVLIFNPLPLVWFPMMVVCAVRRKTDVIYFANMAVLAAFVLAMPIFPQSFNPAMVPLIFTLLLRSVINVFVRTENKRLLDFVRRIG